MIEIGTPFQNCFQFLIWPEIMNDGKNHHSGLENAKPLKKRDCGSHGEGCENIDDQSGVSQLVMLMAAVKTLMRLEALKFLFSMVTGMPIISATLWTVSMASAGCLPHHVFVLVMFVVRTVRWASESGSSFSHLAKVRSAKLVGMWSANQELEVVGIVSRHDGSKVGGGGAVEFPSSARWIGVDWEAELGWPARGGVEMSGVSSPKH